MTAVKVDVKAVNGNPKLWFKPYCHKCRLLFDDWNEFIEHCAKEHWNKPPEAIE